MCFGGRFPIVSSKNILLPAPTCSSDGLDQEESLYHHTQLLRFVSLASEWLNRGVSCTQTPSYSYPKTTSGRLCAGSYG